MTTASPATASPLAAAPPAGAPLDRLALDLADIFSNSARLVASHIAQHLPDTETLLAALPPGALLGAADTYTRHLVYGDPLERFSAMVLVWRPGQASPVHGHRTWCAYRVLRGTLTEQHYRWDPASRHARHANTVTRGAGDTFSVPGGLQHIHALGNSSDEIAVSLHLYGVSRDHIATGVNLLVPADA
ncbi:putative Cysteine dioxygenase type I [Cupriavidus taiwanensis]|uniref:Cysteine dioxygenase type I n=1 Tax=Cupriavidus taiwanensis TaxID=164546 RepID=A0A976G0Y7_9BURK|nr:cysteine dioxygenase family protein [Cupriavidus taiwanensis]SOZ16261.1 putative Cysteine dioxygenase type I [Cupriavidus taiwanensis]SOZ29369.1 putative Cysteine dioxygenase type I [Cupriavidus taiwanensis]SOZ46837.1 putative Cysteine dioxygenase type I [Cupriavidus taiwanensis]SOZ51156.1 putative Cysteine dioxygenase type I [Cupriavidus taiwanensis]SOZ53022.1 putative Cysteine dioxygenase type I [Cupriavidus taiwanensis]